MGAYKPIPVLGQEAFDILNKSDAIQVRLGYFLIEDLREVFNEKAFPRETPHRIPILLESPETVEFVGFGNEVSHRVARDFWELKAQFPNQELKLEKAVQDYLHFAYESAIGCDVMKQQQKQQEVDAQAIMTQIGLTPLAQAAVLDMAIFYQGPTSSFATMTPPQVLTCTLILIRNRFMALASLEGKILATAGNGK